MKVLAALIAIMLLAAGGWYFQLRSTTPEETILGASSGALSPDTGISVAGASADWANPGNILASDNSRATAVGGLVSTATDYLQATDFDFAIPAGATIDGIVVAIEKNAIGTGLNTRDRDVMIVKGGTIGATDKADTATNWNTGADATATYGSASDLWGETWTATDINATTFGVAISATMTGNSEDTTGKAAVDHITITVHYTLGGSFAPWQFSDF